MTTDDQNNSNNTVENGDTTNDKIRHKENINAVIYRKVIEDNVKKQKRIEV